jgi:hypothetical protein
MNFLNRGHPHIPVIKKVVCHTTNVEFHTKVGISYHLRYNFFLKKIKFFSVMYENFKNYHCYYLLQNSSQSKKKQLEFQSLNSILAFHYWNEFLEYRLEIPFCCTIKWNFKPIFQKFIPIMEC